MIKELILCALLVILLAIIYKLFVVRQLFLSEEKKCGAGTFLSGGKCNRCQDGTTVSKTEHTETKCSACSSSEKKKYPICVGSNGPASGKPEWDGLLDCSDGKTPNRTNDECVSG